MENSIDFSKYLFRIDVSYTLFTAETLAFLFWEFGEELATRIIAKGFGTHRRRMTIVKGWKEEGCKNILVVCGKEEIRERKNIRDI